MTKQYVVIDGITCGLNLPTVPVRKAAISTYVIPDMIGMYKSGAHSSYIGN